MPNAPKAKKPGRYSGMIEKIFFDHYKKGSTEFEFSRTELEETAAQLKIKLPRNLGDIIYSFRYRAELPANIKATSTPGREWIIKGSGDARYRFKEVKQSRVIPRDDLVTIKIPDSTPEIITAYALTDEQALLAKVRYNRLIDTFLGVTAYSLQNHLRTKIAGIGQIEIDEVYVGVDKHGRQFIVPIQAKGGKDKHGVVQTDQDIVFCKTKYPKLICRAIAAQFMSDKTIAMFELTVQDDEVKVVEEKHYQLVPAKSITPEDLELYNLHGS